MPEKHIKDYLSNNREVHQETLINDIVRKGLCPFQTQKCLEHMVANGVIRVTGGLKLRLR